jgi:uncharacterized phosphatase
MKICLVRHGETDWNKLGRLQGSTDIPLNETGIMQATLAAHAVKDKGYEIVVTSPLTRAKQTAQIIADLSGLSLIEMEAFKERSYGDAEGLLKEEREQLYPDNIFPNLESYQDLAARLREGLTEVSKFPYENLIIVAHGAAINCILAIFSDFEIGSGKTVLLNACTSIITYENDEWKIESYNDVSHLQVETK